MQSQKKNCPVCHGELVESTSYRAPFALDKCVPCDLVYNRMRNVITHEDVDEFTYNFFDDIGTHPLMFETDYERLLKSANVQSLQGFHVLDIGCGAGLFLKSLRARGIHVVGVEANDVLRQGLIKDGIDCYASIDELRTSGTHLPLDIVYSSHSLEHFIDPFKAVTDMYDVLKTGGVVSITVPCLNRMTYLFEKLTVKSNAQCGWEIFLPVHLTFFNKISLKRMMAKAGFVNFRIMPGVLGENLIRKFFKNQDRLVSFIFKRILLPLLSVAQLVRFTPNICIIAKK